MLPYAECQPAREQECAGNEHAAGTALGAGPYSWGSAVSRSTGTARLRSRASETSGIGFRTFIKSFLGFDAAR
jgi:hypothetical protein